jgi:glutamate synthase (NADPH/NADH) small chain
MGKPTRFIDYLRELPSELPPIDRIRNWDEFNL